MITFWPLLLSSSCLLLFVYLLLHLYCPLLFSSLVSIKGFLYLVRAFTEIDVLSLRKVGDFCFCCFDTPMTCCTANTLRIMYWDHKQSWEVRIKSSVFVCVLRCVCPRLAQLPSRTRTWFLSLCRHLCHCGCVTQHLLVRHTKSNREKVTWIPPHTECIV